MKNITKTIAIATLITLLGIGCSKSETTNTNTNAPKPVITGESRSKPASDAFTVTMDQDGTFLPTTAFITKGTKITWKNTLNKNIRISSDTKELNSKDLKPNETFTYTASKAGRFIYRNGLNPAFGGAVEVIE